MAVSFDTIPHADLMKSLARRISDRKMLRLLKMWLPRVPSIQLGRLRRQRLQQQWPEWRRFRRWRRRELVALVERDRDVASRPTADTNLTHFPAR